MTQTPADALRLVPNMPTVELTDDMLFKIETGETVTWGELKRRQYEQAVRNFNTMREDGSLPAPASPLPGGGVESLIAELKEARRLLADLMVWFGKYPEFKPNPDYMSGVTEDIAKTRAFLARNGKGEGS